jgi:hypothetical protein
MHKLNQHCLPSGNRWSGQADQKFQPLLCKLFEIGNPAGKVSGGNRLVRHRRRAFLLHIGLNVVDEGLAKMQELLLKSCKLEGNEMEKEPWLHESQGKFCKKAWKCFTLMRFCAIIDLVCPVLRLGGERRNSV